MALEFRAYPFPQEQEQDFGQTYVDPILKLTSALQAYKARQNEGKFQQLQMDMTKAKEAREAAQHAYEFGDPNATDMVTPSGFAQRDPRMSLYQPATAGNETQFGNISAASGPESPMRTTGGMVDRFRSWQQARREGRSGMAGQMTEEQLYAPGFGAKRREDYRKYQEDVRKQRESEADIGLKTAQARWWEDRPSSPTGGLLYSPEQSAAIASGDEKQLAAAFPGGVPAQAQSAFQSSRTQRQGLEDRDYKRGIADQALQVPGWNLAAGMRPDDTEAKKARDAVASYQSFKNTVTKLKQLVARYGTVEMTGPESGQMTNLTKALQLELKNIAQLGVLSASDIPFLTEQVPDLNSWRALSTRPDTYIATLDQTLETAGNKLGTFMNSRGYSPSGGGGASPRGSKIKVSNGRETLWIDPSDAADAAKDGYQSVR